jgi:V-type H+-transporting ATPase subunit a
MNSSYETLQKRYLELTEARYVLKETAVYFEEVRSLRYSICALEFLFNIFPY